MSPSLHQLKKSSFFRTPSVEASPAEGPSSGSASTEVNSVVSIRKLRLGKALKSSLLPMHTLSFASSTSNKELIEPLLIDDETLFSVKTNALDSNKDADYEILKELLILAALLGSKNVLEKLKGFNIKIDSEVLNMAIWSGDFQGSELNYFMDRVTPSYNSIRHAILSEKVTVLEQVLNKNPQLKLTSEHSRAIDTVKSPADKMKMQQLLTTFIFSIEAAMPTTASDIPSTAEEVEPMEVIPLNSLRR